VNRDLNLFQSEEYDVIIVGGGIYGATICWEAVSRGLKVALFEKSDFGSATSANSLKIIHGGFRYLQNFDLDRVRESIREQRALMRIAPHLIHPLPVLVPTYGHGFKGKEAFSAGSWLFNYLRSSEEQLGDPEKLVPPSRLISKDECVELLPEIDPKGLNGGTLFYDAQVYNSERLVISFLRSAWEKGAHIANYTEVGGFIKNNGRFRGVAVKDVLTGDVFQATSRIIVLACGPWNAKLLGLLDNPDKKKTTQYAKAVNLVTHKLFDKYAVGIRGRNQHINGRYLLNAKNSFLFISPWRDYSIVGTVYSRNDGTEDSIQINEGDINFLRKELNQIYPGISLSRKDILFAHGGLLPISRRTDEDQKIKLINKFEIIDHGEQGYNGLISVEGVKYTTARGIAQKTVDLLLEKWGYDFVPSTSARTHLYGGEISRFGDYLMEAEKRKRHDMSETQIRSLVLNFGTTYKEVLKYLDNGTRKDKVGNPDKLLLEAQIRYSIDCEMAQRLGDVIFRRTELGSAGHPGNEVIEYTAQIMAQEFDWSQHRIDEEVAAVQNNYSQFLFNSYDHHKERMGDRALQ
jgi:glycerol-3-phosphate dehydrogenase